jgi:[citrate (pro-3S)-lyase] ligase
VAEGTAHLPQVLVHPTGPYLISAATFPDYFLKDSVSPQQVNTELDLTIFAEQYAPPLGIQCRFVGTEPTDPVTAAYNSRMKELLPRYGITVREIPRLEQGNRAVSAGRVRQLLAEGNIAAVGDLVPPSTLNYLVKHYENN